MKKNQSKSKKPTRHGQIPEDWSKQGIQLPRELAKEFRSKAGEIGHGGVKVLGTAAISILLSLDDDDLDTVCSYVRQKTWKESSELKKERVLGLLKLLISDHDDEVPIIEPIWYIDKIVDPELSQPPGKKLSDKKKNDRGKGTA